MNLLPYRKKIDIYLAKCFLLRFLQIFAIFSLIIFFVNLIEALDKASGTDISIFVVALMAFLHIPEFLNDIASSLVLFAAIMTFFFLSNKSEITIIRNCGYSMWHLIYPIAFTAFALGIFWVTVFSPLSIKMMHKFNALEGKYIKKELREVVSSSSGIWIKQTNEEKPGEEVLIQAKRVYKENVELSEVAIWFIDKDGSFYRRLNARKAFLKDGFWLLEGVVLNDFEYLNKIEREMRINTSLKPDFVVDKVVSNFENVKLFSIFALPDLIKSLREAGFHSTKFQVYFNSLLSKPFLFAAMTLIACFFGINNFRNRNTTLMVFLGMLCGLGMYIALSFIGALGASRFIPVFASTWVITFLCLGVGILLIYRKENA